MKRTTFETSRELEFFTERELTMQIGHGASLWPVALAKELIDNALDACETAGTPPEVRVELDDDTLTITDNGPGLSEQVIRRSLDYSVRISDKTHYVSPSRGQLGNALKCLWAAPFVACQGGDGSASTNGAGYVEIEAHGQRYIIRVRADAIEQRPDVQLEVENAPDAENGTTVRVHWPEIASYLAPQDRPHFYDGRVLLVDLITDYHALNPHARFEYVSPRGGSRTYAPSDIEHARWTPDQPTSAHWYDLNAFAGLVAGHLAAERRGGDPLTVRQFIGTFDGLTSSQKQRAVVELAEVDHTYLKECVMAAEDGRVEVDRAVAARLLAAMRVEARPVTPRRLGQIGEDHMLGGLAYYGTDMDTAVYKIRKGEASGFPYVVEVAFAETHDTHAIVTGLNGTPTLTDPFDHVLWKAKQEALLTPRDPTALIVHVAYPAPPFTDRGKTRIDLPREVQDKLADCVRLATKAFTKEKKARRRSRRQARKKQREAEKNATPFSSRKDACYHHMEAAYMKASSGGTLPANARQIMYAIRPLVLADMGKWYANSQSFTQGVLVDFLNDHPDVDDAWDVVYDARGTFWTPHTDLRVPLGTVPVRRYLSGLDAAEDAVNAPEHEFGAVLFVEKEGFEPLLRDAEIAQRFDIAIMSTKGQSVTAARRLIDALSQREIPSFVLHDFDKTGLEITETLRTGGRRYDYDAEPLIYDLGLRLDDVKAYGLEAYAESVTYTSNADPRGHLASCGATEAEQAFLSAEGYAGRWRGQRVELNAFASDELIRFIEDKLTEHGIQKVVPDQETLDASYRGAVVEARIQRKLDALREKLEAEHDPDDVDVPDALHDVVRERIDGTPTRWTEALNQMAKDEGWPDE